MSTDPKPVSPPPSEWLSWEMLAGVEAGPASTRFGARFRELDLCRTIRSLCATRDAGLEQIHALATEMFRYRARVTELEAEKQQKDMCIVDLRDNLTRLEADNERLRMVTADRDRLRAWLHKIDGGDSPCLDESTLRQWAYEGGTLGHDCDE